MSLLLSRQSRSAVYIAGGVAGLLAVAGCGFTTGASAADETSQATITVTPDDTSAASPIQVNVASGTINEVRVVGPHGQVTGTTNEDGTSWTATSPVLDYGAIYRVTATAKDANGRESEVTKSISTVKPKNTFSGFFEYFQPGDTVGVGIVVRLKFDRTIKNKEEVEKNLVITSTKPVEGAWSWDEEDTVVTFRPQTYWPKKAKVTVAANLYGIEAAKGIYGEADVKTKFQTGNSVVATVDANTLQMKVVENGKVIRTIPVTTGKDGFETRSGIKPIMAKEGTVIMDAASGGTARGSSEYYRLTVAYAMRITWSGEYLHAAPWSQGSQGYRSVSHGCVGMSTSNAYWLYNYAKVGDVVVVKNTGRKQDLQNGMTDWNQTWEKWLEKSTGGVQAATLA